MLRKVVSKDGFTFGDGTVLPQGTFVSVANRAASMDPGAPLPASLHTLVANGNCAGNYANAEVFDGFRFARERDEAHAEGREGGAFKHHMISTSAAHLVFGHGKHACPGRCVNSSPFLFSSF